MEDLEKSRYQQLNEARNNGSKPSFSSYQVINITPQPALNNVISNDGTEETNAERLNLSRINDLEAEPPSEENADDVGYEGENGERKKILLSETLLLNMYIIPLDLLCLLLIFFGLDDFWIIDLLTFPVTRLYFMVKGEKAGADLVASVLELIPYVGALPIKSVGLNIAIYVINHPEKFRKMPTDKKSLA